MPVILTTAEEWEVWLRTPLVGACPLQRSLPDGSLRPSAAGMPFGPFTSVCDKA
jgi:hypothetical protein